MGKIDLHMHTTCSDGLNTPEDILALARQAGLQAFAIADHDTVEGYLQIADRISDDDPELMPAVELSVNIDNNDIHLLGYLFDPKDKQIREALDEFRQRRIDRAKMMVAKLNNLKISIAYEEVEAAAGGGAIGRPHVADAMVKSGFVQSYDEAFNRYLRTGAPAYVPKENFSPAEAVELIHQAGGIIVLAHPGLNEAVRYLETLVDLGLDGLEVLHPVHSPQDIVRFGHLAERFRLVTTGGSDYHGRYEASKHGNIGSQEVPAEWLVRMKIRSQAIRGVN